MLLTEMEFVTARKRALENNPRSYEPWYETIIYGREVERLVLSKYWRDYSKEKPHEEGWYAAIVDHPTTVFCVLNLRWSGALSGFIGAESNDVIQNVLFFKSLKELVEEIRTV